MAAYLTGKKLGTRQWYDVRRNPLTGCTVIHDAENVMDTLGPDTGAENVAEYIRTRTTAGSYHDLVDSDSGLQVVEYHHGAFHDGTGSNNWALSLSFACRTVDWARMSSERRAGFLRQGALRFVAQQQWRKANRAPLTRLRYITKAQSDAGESGFCCHGWRDPARRTDPGTKTPHLFPFDEWLDACRVALAELMPDHPDAGTAPAPTGDLDMDKTELIAILRSEGIAGAGDARHMLNNGYRQAMHDAMAAVLRTEGVSGAGDHGRLLAVLQGAGLFDDREVQIDEQELATALAPLLERTLQNLPAASLEEFAKAVVDEQARRLTA